MSRIALVVDNPLRDLPGLVLLAARLAGRGHEVTLVPMNLQHWELFSLAPDYVVANYCRPTNESLLRRLQACGIGVAVLDTEGGVLSSLEAYARTLSREEEVRARIDAFLAWGPALGEYVVREGWFRADQVEVTGAPRLDFYAEPWRAAARRAANGSGDGGALVMLNGNFPVVNPQFQTPEQEAAQLVAKFGYTPERVAEWQRVQRETMEGLAGIANDLARRFPAVTFVYRPHPFEKAATYDRLLERRDNLRLVREGTVDGWILRSVAVIQRSCSTAIESALAGVPALSPVWLPTPVVMETAEAVSDPVPSPDAMAAALEAILDGRYAPPSAARETLAGIVDRWFFRVDGESGARAAERIARGAAAATGADLRLCHDFLHAADARGGARVLAGVRRALGRSPDWSVRTRRSVADTHWAATDKAFDSAGVGRLLGAVAAAAGDALPPLVAEPVRATVRSRYRPRAVTVRRA